MTSHERTFAFSRDIFLGAAMACDTSLEGVKCIKSLRTRGGGDRVKLNAMG
jgi:hypothetical protein